MTANQFRNLALALPEAIESSHVYHPDLRVRNRIFATLGYPDECWGMVKLTPEQQGDFIGRFPEVFHPAAGAWGRSGSTLVLLSAIKPDALRPALSSAWKNIVEKPRDTVRPRRKSSSGAK